MGTSSNKPCGNDALRIPQDSRVPRLLEKVREEGRVWEDLCEQYGVDNPDPPWKVSLEGTFIALARSQAFPWLERRAEEDDLEEGLYSDIPFPERQIVALAHSMIQRGLVDEDELARKMEELDRRFNSA